MNNPLVSIVVPAHGHQPYIQECLRSIADQDYPELELIIIDDLSGDATYRLAKSFVQQEDVRSRFRRIVCKQNRVNCGADATINRGISFAKGEYISLINSDDLYYPERISRLVAALQDSGSRLAFSGVQCIDDVGGIATEEVAGTIPTFAAACGLTNLPTLSFAFLRRQPAISTGNLIFQRSLFDLIGGFIPLKYCHDWDFTLQAIRYTEPVLVEDILYGYRLHGENSFRGLASRAIIESEVVLTRYFKGVLLQRTINQLAPTPYNWPTVFEAIVSHFEVDSIWEVARTGQAGRSRVR